MKVTSADIRRKEFKRSVRGYIEEDVDVFLDTVADEIERLSEEKSVLEERVQTLEEQVAGHEHIREALEKTLVAAQLQSEEIRSKAEKESQSIVQEAESQARAVVDDLYAQTRKVQQTLMQLKLLEEDFRFKFRALLEGYLKLVEEGPILLSGLQGEMQAAGAPQVEKGRAGGSVRDSGPVSEFDGSATSETVEASAVVGSVDDERATRKREEEDATSNSAESEGGDGKLEGDAEKGSASDGDGEAESSRGGKKDKHSSGADKKGAADDSSSGEDLDDSGDLFPEDGAPATARDFKW